MAAWKVLKKVVLWAYWSDAERAVEKAGKSAVTMEKSDCMMVETTVVKDYLLVGKRGCCLAGSWAGLMDLRSVVQMAASMAASLAGTMDGKLAAD